MPPSSLTPADGQDAACDGGDRSSASGSEASARPSSEPSSRQPHPKHKARELLIDVLDPSPLRCRRLVAVRRVNAAFIVSLSLLVVVGSWWGRVGDMLEPARLVEDYRLVLCATPRQTSCFALCPLSSTSSPRLTGFVPEHCCASSGRGADHGPTRACPATQPRDPLLHVDDAAHVRPRPPPLPHRGARPAPGAGAHPHERRLRDRRLGDRREPP